MRQVFERHIRGEVQREFALVKGLVEHQKGLMLKTFARISRVRRHRVPLVGER